MRSRVIMLAAATALAVAPVYADEKHHPPAGTTSAVQGDWADGEVRRVDKDAQKLTIRHGPLPSLDMPTPMTMVYRVKDIAMLDQTKAGDKVRFRAEKIGGAFTVTAIEPTK